MHQPIIHAGLLTGCPRHHLKLSLAGDRLRTTKQQQLELTRWHRGTLYFQAHCTASHACKAVAAATPHVKDTQRGTDTNAFKLTQNTKWPITAAWLPCWPLPLVCLVLLLLPSHWLHHQPAPLHKQGGRTGQAGLHA